MRMTRRGLFGLLAAVPLAGLAAWKPKPKEIVSSRRMRIPLWYIDATFKLYAEGPNLGARIINIGATR